MATSVIRDLRAGKGMSFEEFAHRCALKYYGKEDIINIVSLASRDVPKEPKAQPEKLSTLETLEWAESEVARIKAWGKRKANREAKLSYDKARLQFNAEIEASKAVRARFMSMLDKVNHWSPDHDENMYYGFREFMAHLLSRAMFVDSLVDRDISVPELLTGDAYKQERLFVVRHAVADLFHDYNREQHEEKKRAAWFAGLPKKPSESSDA